jgi:hypothetical protein
MFVGCVVLSSGLFASTCVCNRCDAQEPKAKQAAQGKADNAVEAAREAARRAQSMNNLKQIALAMHIYHDVKKGFPARASADANGKPLLSWRVHILPYVEQEALYKEFHLNEPWDSEHNKKLIAKMPAVYRQPNGDPKEFKTNYLVPVAKGTIFETLQPCKLNSIIDGTSTTIMAVEASLDRSVEWTKPDDLEIDLAAPMKGLLGLRPKGFLVAFADGSVQFLPETLGAESLRGLLTKAGGEVVNR